MTCGVPHPERPLTCEADDTHADHLAWTPEGFVYWANDGFVAPPPPDTRQQRSRARDRFLEAAGQVAPEVRIGVDPGPSNVGVGRAEGSQAMAQVIENTDEEWKAAFTVALDQCAATGLPFTSEDVVDRVGLPDEAGSLRNNVIGALMNAAAKRGLIRKTGAHGVSRRERSHGAEITQWIGTAAPAVESESFVMRDFG